MDNQHLLKAWITQIFSALLLQFLLDLCQSSTLFLKAQGTLALILQFSRKELQHTSTYKAFFYYSSEKEHSVHPLSPENDTISYCSEEFGNRQQHYKKTHPHFQLWGFMYQDTIKIIQSIAEIKIK